MIEGDERLQRVNRFWSRSGVCSRASSQMGPIHIGAIMTASEARSLIMISTGSRFAMITSILMSVHSGTLRCCQLATADALDRRLGASSRCYGRPLVGSTVMDAFFASAVPSLTLPGDMRVGLTDIIATLVLGAAFARLLRVRRLQYLPPMAGPLHGPSHSFFGKRSHSFRNPDQREWISA